MYSIEKDVLNEEAAIASTYRVVSIKKECTWFVTKISAQI